ncbi:MAG: DUF6703 family protein [Candidatus Nanopelagicales bacterium]|nr:hypothetical protein [Candidatus Nanopelagicales bacterium]MDZ4250698.1 DUF6703 family protein [Candidatus Nanopelagicales bacterium]
MSQSRKKSRKRQSVSGRNRGPARVSASSATKTVRRPQAVIPQRQSHARKRLERASAPMLIRLHATPRWLLGVLLGLMLLAGLGLSESWSPLAGFLLAVIGSFVAWLSALAWPVLTPGSRVARVAVVAAILGISVLKFMGQF